MDITKYLAIGLAVGLISGTLGIGGGVLMLPALMWLCSLKPSEAAGTTLAVLVVPVVLPAALEYYRRGQVNVQAAMCIAMAFGFGGYAGAWLRNNGMIPDETLRVVFGLLTVYVAFHMIVMSDSAAANAVIGLLATAAAWLSYLGLRLLGKRALAQPRLQEQIQRMSDQGRGDHDYYI